MARPKTHTDDIIKELKEKLNDYINNNDIPIIAEFAYLNDIPRSSLYDFEELSTLLKKAIDKKESQLERMSLKGEVNVSMAIFSLKQLGWRDSQEIKHSGKIASGIDSMSQEEKVKLEKTLRVILAEELNKPD